MKDNYRKIVIIDKGAQYIFQLKLLVKPDVLADIRKGLKQQIEEGCVILPPYIDWVNE